MGFLGALKATRAVVLIAASVSLPAWAEECYRADDHDGSMSFEVKQAGSPFRGRFRSFGGEVCLSDGRATRIDVWLDPATVEAGLPEIDAALKGADFFAVDRYPRVSYTSQSVEEHASMQLAHGVLEIKGRRGDLDVSFSVQRDGEHPLVSGTLTFDRLAYGIGTGEWSSTQWLGARIDVRFRATLSAK